VTTAEKGPLWARSYVGIARTADDRGAREHRRQLLANLNGRVVEIGAGQGANFAHYPNSVTDVLAIEPEPFLRTLATSVARDAPVPVTVVDGHAERVRAGDASFDAAVVSLVLCSVPEQAAALAEIRRVLKPGAELRFYEHVVSERAIPSAIMRLVDATFWPRVAGGCHCARDTARAIERAGFTVTRIERFGFRATRFQPSVPHILGIARREWHGRHSTRSSARSPY